ncbi:MAG: hypothetical protein IPL56_16260 [Saprospiraceae bacterium]|jgi:hypothetical protein|nr:hypothetical protein [Saprospiraceae bacterium]MBK8513764.1 hypothetical protein [Saprospiraceae bacterium]MBP7921638.1 hypothetical protein [Saprospiraceae bacterium]MBP8941236.1 hypothetical protein [Saprospiraceae bacterium]MBP9743804.1 hypothetical protein [Saprospiraceae bacterium]
MLLWFNSILTSLSKLRLTKTVFLFLFIPTLIFAQQEEHQGVFNAYLTTQAGIFIRDSSIGASGTPQYDHQLFGGETWLDARYSNWGFDFGIRMDFYQNSNLINPQASFNQQGIGRWFVKKSFSKLGFEAGYIYDQIGSGILYRAYEQRNLGLDNALYGLKLNYDISPDWRLKAFSGKQKKQFETYESLIKGLSIEGYLQGSDSSHWSWAPGFGMTNRTLDDASMNNLLATLGTYQPADQFLPAYNSYSFTLFNTVQIKDVGFYLETAIKNDDVLQDANGRRLNAAGETILGPKFIKKSGHVIYGSMNYSNADWGLSIEGKRTQYFGLRTRPQEGGNNGLIHFIPPMSRQNSYRLLSFYQPATQELGELAFQGEMRITLTSDWDLLLHHSNIDDLHQNKLYREYLVESTITKSDKYTLIFGTQLQQYNQEVYEGKPQAPLVKTLTPFVDFTHQWRETRALRIDAEYMMTAQDQGDWTNLLIEYSVAPRWIFSISDMYNLKPLQGPKNNYYTGGVTYAKDAGRASINYVRQRAGIVCSGGICRYEPAFNGVKFNLETRF